ncbi:response regulator [Candidatus Enterovibrio escicola]|uniref:response regulator n=1 Tax=Candidatus Enterovibrio escicola TaxID=1927127 RepID=UPI001237ED1D|nr:response regulator [Candidatus Enterovibrio escacola]
MIRALEVKNGCLNYIPIIALSANAMKEDKQKCLDVGMDDFLVKPYEVNDLQQLMRKWLPRDNVKMVFPYLQE